jgi:hypothetical protein
MALPLLYSIIKPTDFDKQLDEIGLQHLTGEDRIKLVDELTEAAQYTVVTRMLTTMTPEQKVKLTELMKAANKSGDHTEANQYVLEQFPDIDVLVDEVAEDLMKQLKPGPVSLQHMLDSYIKYKEQKLEFQANELGITPDEVTPGLPVSKPDTTDTEPVNTVDTSLASPASEPEYPEESFIERDEHAEPVPVAGEEATPLTTPVPAPEVSEPDQAPDTDIVHNP